MLSHQELADLAGTSREVVSRFLEKLERVGAIELGRKRITILDSEKLEAVVR
jgi:CRP/FNR family transcriptional regulator